MSTASDAATQYILASVYVAVIANQLGMETVTAHWSLLRLCSWKTFWLLEASFSW